MKDAAGFVLLIAGVVLAAVGLWWLHPGALLVVAGGVCWTIGGRLLE